MAETTADSCRAIELTRRIHRSRTLGAIVKKIICNNLGTRMRETSYGSASKARIHLVRKSTYSIVNHPPKCLVPSGKRHYQTAHLQLSLKYVSLDQERLSNSDFANRASIATASVSGDTSRIPSTQQDNDNRNPRIHNGNVNSFVTCQFFHDLKRLLSPPGSLYRFTPPNPFVY